ncbi:helix-turn-helix domain-containing protein [Actinokineospora sp.]|uniref:helix-turn-helix domain-containing protein n=1 Tax=Actinokineospora sp. TaxID=1872133 RepID=UPI004037851E
MDERPAADAMSLGNLVRRGRLTIGATQEELAHRAGVSVRTIRNLESGRIGSPRLSSVRAIAAALALDADRSAEVIALATTDGDTVGEEATPPVGGVIREPLTGLIGRDGDVAKLVEVLADRAPRLVTLTGIAGIGKTRLAQAAARAAQAHGVPTWWVPLAAISRADLVVSAVADAVDAPEPSVTAIGGRLPDRAVLVVDNVEHLPGVGTVVADLLRELPGVTVLATGRAPLRVAGEQEWPVSRLAVPDTGEITPATARRTPASALLIERIRSTTPEFELTADTTPLVAEVSRLLDGLPLSIELAAAQWRVRGGTDLLRSIRRDPLGLRDVGARTSADHVSLRAALDATCELLTDGERATLRRLAVFRGGWTLDAATEVVGAETVIDHLDRLLALGLVQSADTPTGRRFSMLPTITAFAEDEARDHGVDADAACRHSTWVHRWALGLDLSADGINATAGHVNAERDNVRAALAWFDRNDPGQGLNLTSALYHYWCRGHADEGLAWYLATADRADDAAARSTGLRQAAWLARRVARLADAEDLADSALRESGDDPVLRGRALTALAIIVELRKPGRGIQLHAEAVELAERAGKPALLCHTLSQLAVCETDLGHHDDAIRVLNRCAATAKEHGLVYARLVALLNIAHNRNVLGDHAGADTTLVECELLVDAAGPPDARTYWRAQRAIARLNLGDVSTAAELARLALADATGEREHQNTNEARIAMRRSRWPPVGEPTPPTPSAPCSRPGSRWAVRSGSAWSWQAWRCRPTSRAPRLPRWPPSPRSSPATDSTWPRRRASGSTP